MIKLSDEILKWAGDEHSKIGQMYSTYLPYRFHLNLAVRIADKYIELIPEEDREIVRGAVASHDLLEDTHNTYNDLKNALWNMPLMDEETHQILTGDKITQICEIVYAVTNEKGRNRKQRANDRYYKGIRETKYASFVKLCDRIANVLFGIMFNGESEMYEKENPMFLVKLQSEELKDYEQMIYDLDRLFATKAFSFQPLTFPKKD